MFSFSKLYVPACFAVAALALASRLLFLDEIPRGLYCDESNIGYNAALIAETGVDEHGEKWPLFFRAFGDARKPALVYMAAAIFKLAGGPSPFALRLGSVVFFFVFLLAFWLLVRRLFASHAVRFYALAAASFLPWLFRPSRYAIEIASHPCAVMLALYFFHRAYAPKPEEAGRRRRFFDAAAAGFFLAASLYTYEAATVLSFGMLAIVPLVYWRREDWKKHAALLGGFALAWGPWLWYALANPGVMTSRFRNITYWYADIRLVDKISLFLETYFGYLGPKYLLSTGEVMAGEPSAGEAHGVLFGVVFALALAGAARMLASGRIWTDRFSMFLFLNFWFTPFVGGISRAHHVSLMRGALMAIYFLVFSCHGLAWLLEASGARRRAAAFAAVLAILAAQTAFYMRYYFVEYPPRSIDVFESWDFGTALQKAVDEKPSRVIVSHDGNQPQAHRDFYSKVIRNPDRIPVEMGEAKPVPGACLVYFSWNEGQVHAQPDKHRQIPVPQGLTLVRCYD